MFKKSTILANFMLILAAFIWGLQSVFQKLATAEMRPVSFYGGRCIVGVMTMVVIIILIETGKYVRCKRNKNKYIGHQKSYFISLLKATPWCVITNVLANSLAQTGFHYTSASKGAFLTAINIVFVPILAYFILKQKTSLFTWIATLISVVGLYFMCITDAYVVEKGDFFFVGAAVFYALHIILVGRFVKQFNGIYFACIEFSIAGLFCVLFGIIFENTSIQQYIECFPFFIICGVFGIGICYALQFSAQTYTNPTIAAMLLSLESIFASIAGYVILDERFTNREILGVILIVSAIILAQLPFQKKY